MTWHVMEFALKEPPPKAWTRETLGVASFAVRHDGLEMGMFQLIHGNERGWTLFNPWVRAGNGDFIRIGGTARAAIMSQALKLYAAAGGDLHPIHGSARMTEEAVQ